MRKGWLSLTDRVAPIRRNTQVHDKAFGAAMPALSFGMMNDIGVVTPNSTAQNGFVDFVKQVDKSKATVQKALDETQLLFDSLMQKYFG